MRSTRYIGWMVVWLILPLGILESQTRIRLLDRDSGTPVPFAHVCSETLDKSTIVNQVADQEGRLQLEIERPFQLAVTAVGYTPLIDTLQPGGSITLYLQKGFTELDEVVVTAQYSPRPADRSIYKVDLIGRREIRERGASNLKEALNQELGIQISQDAALGSSMSIQGLTGEHVKILVDGVPLIGRMNGNIDLSQISLFNADRIEVVEGPMSVVYGSNALAGAVNIITSDHTLPRLSAWANAYLESVGVYNFDLGTSGRFGRHGYSLAASRNFFSGFSEADTSRSKQWKPRLQYNLNGKYFFHSERFSLGTDLSWFDETIEQKGHPLPPYFENAFDSYFMTRRASARINADYRFASGGKLESILAYSLYSRKKESWFKDLTTLTKVPVSDASANDTTEFSAILVRAIYTNETANEKLNFQIGTDINVEEGRGKRIAGSRQSLGDYALFGSLQYEPHPSLSIQPGLRYAYNTRYDSPLVPSLNLRLRPAGSNHTFRASYARGFRAPSLKELYLYFVDINHNLRGNPGLKAEHSHNFNLNWDHPFNRRLHRFQLQAGLFYNTIVNRITLARNSATLYSYINLDRYRTAGGKLEVGYKLHPRFALDAGLFHIGRRAEGPYRFSTDVSSSLNYYWISRNIRLRIHYKYTDRQPQFVSTAEGEIEEGFIGSYHMMEISLIKSWWNENITAGLGVKNLFDYTSIESGGVGSGIHSSAAGTYPVGWGRTFYVNLRFRLQKFQ